jgi:hypothetical protein
VSGTPRRNLFVFAKICGDKYARNVVFLTTMWDKAHSMEEVEKREMILNERYWNLMLPSLVAFM